MTASADVIIIGSGIVGSATAYNLIQQGHSVIVLERGNIGEGASSRNGGGVRLTGRDPREHYFAVDAIGNFWPTLSEELGVDVEYRRCGNLRLAHTEKQEQLLHGVVRKMAALDVPLEVISGDEARRICPALSHDVIAAVYCTPDGVANPMVTTLGYYRRARALGVHYFSGEEAASIEKHCGRARRVVCRSGNTYEADTIVLAAGITSRALLNTVGLDVRMLRRIDECIVTEIVPPLCDQRLSTPDGNLYGHQTEHGSFIFGGNTQMERYEKAYDGNARNTTVACPDKCRAATKYLPALKGVKVVRQWAGWLDSCVDRLPVIDAPAEVPGLIIACAFSGHGFAIGPSVGRVLSEMVRGETPSVDISGLRYDRFQAAGDWS